VLHIEFYVFVFGLLGLGLGSLLGFHLGGFLGMLAIGPVGALIGASIAALGRQVFEHVFMFFT
jgi:hypothetical protein